MTVAPWLIIQGDLGEWDSRGRLRVCSLLECHLRDISGLLYTFMGCLRLYLLACGWLYMFLGWLWVVVEFFEVVANGFGWL